MSSITISAPLMWNRNLSNSMTVIKLYGNLMSDRKFTTTASIYVPNYIKSRNLVTRPPPSTPSVTDSKKGCGSMKNVEYLTHPAVVLYPALQSLPVVHERTMRDQMSIVSAKSDRTDVSIK